MVKKLRWTWRGARAEFTAYVVGDGEAWEGAYFRSQSKALDFSMVSKMKRAYALAMRAGYKSL